MKHLVPLWNPFLKAFDLPEWNYDPAHAKSRVFCLPLLLE
jgi:hypothetical protein